MSLADHADVRKEVKVSEAAAHEVIVDAPLAHDLERLGVHVHAGDRVRLQLVEPLETDSGRGANGSTDDELWDAFIGSGGDSGDPDLSVKAKDIVRAELGA